MQSRDETLQLFKEGNSLQEIAQKRKLSYFTIENHFADLIADKKMKADELVGEEKIGLIKKAAEGKDFPKLKKLKEILPQNITFAEIKWALASINKYRAKPINPPIIKAIHTYRALNCFRKCFNHYNILDDCAEKFEKLAKSYGSTEINIYDFIKLMNTGQISICKLSLKNRELRINWKEFEEMKNDNNGLWNTTNKPAK